MTYSPEFKKTLARLYPEGRTLTSLKHEYGVAESTIYDWSKKYREKCLEKTADEGGKSYKLEQAEEIEWLQKRIVELEKENKFLKKAKIFAREIDWRFRFIDENKQEFGVRRLPDKFEISPNAYYNHLKHRKAEYPERSQETLDEIGEIYRERNCVPGYRMMKAFLEMKGIKPSCLTVYKYMKEPGIRSVVRRKRPAYRRGECDKVFPKSLNGDFYAEERNLKRCTDFTFLQAAGDERFCCNCTVWTFAEDTSWPA